VLTSPITTAISGFCEAATIIWCPDSEIRKIIAAGSEADFRVNGTLETLRLQTLSWSE